MSTKGTVMKKLLLALLLGCSMSVSAYAKNTQAQTKYIEYDSIQIKELVTTIAERHKIPLTMAHAIVYVESKYNPRLRGQLGEYGLGQIRCSTAIAMGFKGKCDELYNPETNLEYSMLYLRYALDLSNNDACMASAFYSSGVITKRKTAYCKQILAFIN
jgi:soluble lytic murein transglycosylase-like protein